MSDESHFELSACVNKQNGRNCSEAKLNGLHMKQIHSQRVTAWSGISAFGIIGPYFFRGWNWQCGFFDIWPVYAYGEWVLVSRVTPSWHRPCHHVVLTSWRKSTHCSAVNEHLKNRVWKSYNLPLRRHFLASPFTRSVGLWLRFVCFKHVRQTYITKNREFLMISI